MAQITATVSGAAPITASVGETQIDVAASSTAATVEVAVSGGFGPSGANGAAGPQGEPGDPGELPPGDEGQVLTYVDGVWIAADSTGGNPFDQSLDTTDSPTFAGLTLTGPTQGISYDDLSDLPSLGAVATSNSYNDLDDLPSLGAVATSNSYNDLDDLPSLGAVATSNSYNDLDDRPSLGAAATSNSYNDLSDLPSLFDGDYNSLSGTPSLGLVATSNAYNDLDNLPSLFDGDYNSLANRPSLFDGNYSSLSGTPSTFAPVTASSSVIGGVRVGTGLSIDGDGILSADGQAWSTITSTPTSLSGYGITDAASATHTHAASDINSGTLSIDRIPTGTTSTTVSLGDHTHAQLHDRSHAITSTSDHTATAWRAFYSNGSGQIVELALGAQGTVLTSGGASAAPTFETPASTTPTVASPSQITSNQNDYGGATASINRLDADAARDITGLSGGSSGLTRVLINVGSNAITLKHQSTSSTAANRIIVPWASDYILDPSYAAVLVYDATTSRWRII